MKIIRLLCLCLFAMQANAADGVFQLRVDKPVDEAYAAVYKALEDARFYVVFEANIGKNLAGFAERWGEDYNRSELSAIRSMVFCNGWYANQVSNLDPSMLGFCPLHLTLIEKNGTATVLFNRPSMAAGTSPAVPVLREVENAVIAAINKALQP
ncbi:MAG: DUF302 domain-containing protein [Gammaproteobacteria bacterium]